MKLVSVRAAGPAFLKPAVVVAKVRAIFIFEKGSRPGLVLVGRHLLRRLARVFCAVALNLNSSLMLFVAAVLCEMGNGDI